MVAVTGGTGFIGRRLCARMIGNGLRVRVLARNPGKATTLAEAGAEIVAGDIHSRQALDQLVEGATAIVHAAGETRGNELNHFLDANREGTRLLLETVAARAGTTRLLLLSSLAAREPQLSWYARSKREGENLVTASPLDWVVMRPPAVYGPGDEEMKAIFDWMARGIALVPGRPDARTSLIHVDDLVQAIIACLASEAASGQVLELGDPKTGGYDWRELAAIAATAYGRPVRLLRLPTSLLDAVAAVNLWSSRLTGRQPMLTPPKLRELRHENWVCDNAAITEATGWLPRIPLHDGLGTLHVAAL